VQPTFPEQLIDDVHWADEDTVGDRDSREPAVIASPEEQSQDR
jgi:hypothetical protein